MSDFEWRSPETYAKLQTAEAADFAGECGRRKSHCRESYRTPRNGEAIAAIDGISRERWETASCCR
jgi:transcriptional regulator